MCDPIIGASVGLAVLSGGANFAQQSAQASAQEDYQSAVHSRNVELQQRDAFQKYQQLNQRRAEESEAAAREIDSVSREAQLARGSAAVAAGEAGVQGASVNAFLDDFSRQELEFREATLRSEEFRDRQLLFDKESVRTGQEAATLSTLPQPVQRPSFLGAGLNIVGDSLSNYTSLKRSNIF